MTELLDQPGFLVGAVAGYHYRRRARDGRRPQHEHQPPALRRLQAAATRAMIWQVRSFRHGNLVETQNVQTPRPVTA
jgi:hypothetical protein